MHTSHFLLDKRGSTDGSPLLFQNQNTQRIALTNIYILLIIYILTNTNAFAFVPIRIETSSEPARWGRSDIRFRVNTNISNSPMTEASINNAFGRSFNQWQTLANNSFQFFTSFGRDFTRFPAQSNAGPDNVIYFTSQAATNFKLSCGLIGLTEILFDGSSSRIRRTDVRFNDECFSFTQNVNDTSSTLRGQNRVFLEDVAVHELGHVLGLSHSQVLESSMIFSAAHQMFKPSCDDKAGIQSLYGGPHQGSIRGQVRGPSNTPIFGAHITAIHIETGRALTGTLSLRDGSFELTGLLPGAYTLTAEHYAPGESILGPYYRNFSTRFCNGQPFARSVFYTGEGLTVAAGSRAEAGILDVQCNNNFFENTTQALAGPRDSVPGTVAITNIFRSQRTHTYQLPFYSGALRVKALSYSLFTRPNVAIDIIDERGVVISSNRDNVFSSISGYINYDAESKLNIFSPQNLTVRVQNQEFLDDSRFPSGHVGVSQESFYILTISNILEPQTDGYYGNHPRCETATNDSFSTASFTPDAISNDTPQKSSGCGTIKDISNEAQRTTLKLNLSLVLSLCGLGSFLARKHSKKTPAPKLEPQNSRIPSYN